MRRKSLLRRSISWAATGIGGAFALANLGAAYYIKQELVRPRRKNNHTSELDNFVPDVSYDLESHTFRKL